MKNTQKFFVLILSLAMLLSLAACSKDPSGTTAASSTVNGSSESAPETTEAVKDRPFEPTVTGIYVNRAGRIFSAEVTSFDNSGFDTPRYDETELCDFVDAEVKAYNSAKGFDAVVVESLTFAGKKATLILSYDSPASFLDFQGTDFGVKDITVTTVGEMMKNDQDLPGLKRMDGEIASVAEATKYPEAQVICLTGHCLLTIGGDMYCYSEETAPENEASIRAASDKIPVCVLVR